MHLLKPARSVALVAVLVLAACSDRGDTLLRPDPGATEPPSLAITLTCTAFVQAGTVTCDDPRTPSGASAAILGGQNVYVTLASSNALLVADTFGVDVTVTNLIPQPLGTTDGTSADPAGVRVFFSGGPTSTTGGTVTVANADGTGMFTAADQAYHQYNGILPQDSTSAVKRWKFHVTPEVGRFTFVVLVSAAVQYPSGYLETPYVITLDPGEVRTLTGTALNFRGDVLAGEVISWSSDAPATASTSGTQVTAGASRGFASLTATNGPRSGLYTTAVSVCQSVVVTNGTSLPSSISSGDCFSSYGNPDGRPTTDYYADLFRVALTAGQTITVTMDSGEEGLDTYLLLAAPVSGFLVAGNDDDDEGVLGVGSRLVYTATESGVFVIEASTYNDLDEGDYTLGVTIS